MDRQVRLMHPLPPGWEGEPPAVDPTDHWVAVVCGVVLVLVAAAVALS